MDVLSTSSSEGNTGEDEVDAHTATKQDGTESKVFAGFLTLAKPAPFCDSTILYKLEANPSPSPKSSSFSVFVPLVRVHFSSIFSPQLKVIACDLWPGYLSTVFDQALFVHFYILHLVTLYLLAPSMCQAPFLPVRLHQGQAGRRSLRYCVSSASLPFIAAPLHECTILLIGPSAGGWLLVIMNSTSMEIHVQAFRFLESPFFNSFRYITRSRIVGSCRKSILTH